MMLMQDKIVDGGIFAYVKEMLKAHELATCTSHFTL